MLSENLSLLEMGKPCLTLICLYILSDRVNLSKRLLANENFDDELSSNPGCCNFFKVNRSLRFGELGGSIRQNMYFRLISHPITENLIRLLSPFKPLLSYKIRELKTDSIFSELVALLINNRGNFPLEIFGESKFKLSKAFFDRLVVLREKHQLSLQNKAEIKRWCKIGNTTLDENTIYALMTGNIDESMLIDKFRLHDKEYEFLIQLPSPALDRALYLGLFTSFFTYNYIKKFQIKTLRMSTY